MKLLVINGPNIQLLGRRDPGIYGSMTLPQLELKLQETARELGVECECFQSNHEGAIIDRIQEAYFETMHLHPSDYAYSWHQRVSKEDSFYPYSILPAGRV